MEKVPYVTMLKNSSETFMDPDPEVDHFQNLIIYLFYIYICESCPY